MNIEWINANKCLPKENQIVIFRDLLNNDKICKAQYGKWNHNRDGEYNSWHINNTFTNYLSEGQYWIIIPSLP